MTMAPAPSPTLKCAPTPGAPTRGSLHASPGHREVQRCGSQYRGMCGTTNITSSGCCIHRRHTGGSTAPPTPPAECVLPGWHKFSIERLADGTTIKFTVDDVATRTITGVTAQDWNTVLIGAGQRHHGDHGLYGRRAGRVLRPALYRDPARRPDGRGRRQRDLQCRAPRSNPAHLPVAAERREHRGGDHGFAYGQQRAGG